MSEQSLSSTSDPVRRLRQLRASCTGERPLDPALARWLGHSIDLYLERKSASLEAALGLARAPGGLAWWRAEALQARDTALRMLAGNHFGSLSPTAQAREIALAARRYGASTWRFDRVLASLPPDCTGTPRGFLFQACRSGAPMPLGERQIRNILKNGKSKTSGGVQLAPNSSNCHSISEGVSG